MEKREVGTVKPLKAIELSRSPRPEGFWYRRKSKAQGQDDYRLIQILKSTQLG